MPFHNTRLLTNRLIRRVRRHQAVAMLYRQVAPTELRTHKRRNTSSHSQIVLGQMPAGGVKEVTVPHAVAVPLSLYREPESLEDTLSNSQALATVVPARVESTPSSPVQPAPKQRSTLDDNVSGTAEHRHNQGTGAVEIDSGTLTSQPVPSATVQTELAAADASWSRLQAIFQAHERQRTPTAAAQPKSLSASPTQRATEQSTPPVARSLQHAGTEQDGMQSSAMQKDSGPHEKLLETSSEVLAVESQAALQPTEDHTAAERPAGDAVQAELVTNMPSKVVNEAEQTNKPAAENPADLSIADSMSVQRKSRERSEMVVSSDIKDTSTLPEFDVDLADVHTDGGQVDETTAAAKIGAADGNRTGNSSSPLAKNLPTPETRRPLEQVWPVQRTTEQQWMRPDVDNDTEEQATWAHKTTAEPTPTRIDGSATLSAIPPAAADPGLSSAPQIENATVIENLLHSVRPAQKTDSAIHVMTPRRPRPTVRRASLSPHDEPDDVSSNGAVTSSSELTAPVQTKVEEPHAQFTIQPRNEPPDSAQLAPRDTEHKNAGTDTDQTASTAGEHSASTVETEIGMLPSDLWYLIDEPMPEQQGASAEQSPAPLANPTPKSSRFTQSTGHDDMSTDIAAVTNDLPLPLGIPPAGERQPDNQAPTIHRLQRKAVETSSSHTSHLSSVQRQTALDDETTVTDDITNLSAPTDSTVVPTEAAADDVMPLNAVASKSGDSEEKSKEQHGDNDDDAEISELARQVYAYLQRRLVVEQERIR